MREHEHPYSKGSGDGEDNHLLALPSVSGELRGCKHSDEYVGAWASNHTILTNATSKAVLELRGVWHGGELASGDGVSDLDAGHDV